jgi:hypothetical protein
MYAGRHNNIFVRMLSAPGLWVQRLTTKEPTLDMLEIAIVSTKCALRDEIPEFMEFFNNREWEKKNEEASDVENNAEALAEIAKDNNEKTEDSDNAAASAEEEK